MHKMEFVELLEKALAEKKGIEVAIHMPNLPLNELIYNGAENIPEKAIYYMDVYDDSMRHKNNKDVRIISATVK